MITFQDIEEETGESQNTDNDTGNTSSQSGENEIIIELQDDSGNQKTITIKVK